MTHPGRNDPCHCGSGKKYKHCHQPSDVTPTLLLPARVREILEIDNRMRPELMDFALRTIGKDWFSGTLDDYLPDATMEELEEEGPLFLPWALFHDRIDRLTIAERYIESPPRPIGPSEREWAAAESNAWLSVWEITRVERDTGIHLRDMLSGETRFVTEITASRTLAALDCLLCRITDYADFSLFSGFYPRPLPPREADRVIQEARRMLKKKVKPVPIEQLRDPETMAELVDLWREVMEELASGARMPKQLANMDGDPLLLTTDTFSFDPKIRKHLVARLSILKGAELLESEDDSISIHFVREGKAERGPMQNIAIGIARFGANSLTLETNSLKRADDLKRRVVGAYPELDASPLRKHEDPMAMLKKRSLEPRGPEPGERAEATPPEAQSALREFKRRHYLGWLDSKIPALGGLTPREATKKSGSRRQLDLLLKEIEHGEAKLPEAERVSVADMRRELGMDS